MKSYDALKIKRPILRSSSPKCLVISCSVILFLLIMSLTSGIAAIQTADSGPNIEEKAVRKVPPIYPPLAKRKRVQGKVLIKLQVNPDGTVSNTEFMEGNALFKPASLEAAKQWAFQKSSSGMNGHIIFRFQLDEQ